MAEWTFGLFGNVYRVATLHTMYPNCFQESSHTESFKRIGQFRYMYVCMTTIYKEGDSSPLRMIG